MGEGGGKQAWSGKRCPRRSRRNFFVPLTPGQGGETRREEGGGGNEQFSAPTKEGLGWPVQSRDGEAVSGGVAARGRLKDKGGRQAGRGMVKWVTTSAPASPRVLQGRACSL